jgi:hypothetical protein
MEYIIKISSISAIAFGVLFQIKPDPITQAQNFEDSHEKNFRQYSWKELRKILLRFFRVKARNEKSPIFRVAVAKIAACKGSCLQKL